jgi:hypothetical protein
MYCTALLCSALCHTVLYSTALHCPLIYCTALRCTVLRCATLSHYSMALYCTELYCSFSSTAFCRAVLHWYVWWRITVHCTVLDFVALLRTPMNLLSRSMPHIIRSIFKNRKNKYVCTSEKRKGNDTKYANFSIRTLLFLKLLISFTVERQADSSSLECDTKSH